MTTVLPVCTVALLAVVAFAAPQAVAQPWTDNDRSVTQHAAPAPVRAFPLSAVRLLDGPFLDAMRTDAQYLFSLEPDRLLHGFYSEAGMQPKAEPYGGWETDGLGGHTLGHFLSAASMYFAASGDSTILERITYIVDEMGAIQRYRGNGYVAAIPGGDSLWQAVAIGKIETSGFRLNGVWAPWYTIHKELAGLLDVYWNTSNDAALIVARGLADWAIATTSDLTPDDWQKMLRCEYGGMNEALANLYDVTGEAGYLTLSRKFHDAAVLHPLAERIPDLTGLHANTQIPKVIGIARQYELIGDDSLKTIADFFWEQMVDDHSYVIGGNSMGEYLGEPGKLSERLDAATAETCNTYNMLRLTRHLFTLSPKARYGDYYERALYNHILASQDPKTGMFTYYMSLKPGHYKTYSTPEGAFWCCVGSGMENHVRYGEAIYFHDDSDLYVNLFLASELQWAEKGIRIRQETVFPREPATRLIVTSESSRKFTVSVRHPAWAQGVLDVRVNGAPVDVSSTPGSFLPIARVWNNGDTLSITFPMHLRTEAMPDNKNRVAIMYGPVVLAGRLGSAEMPAGGAYSDSDTEFIEAPTPEVPVLVADVNKVTDWVRSLAGDPLRFHTVGVGRPYDVLLEPFYQIHHERYTIYWDVFNETDWSAAQKEYKAARVRQRRIDESTIDVVRLGEMLGEQAHNFASDQSRSGVAFGRKYREASGSGWLAFDISVSSDDPTSLMCTYWGSDKGNRTFEILINGSTIAKQSLEAEMPNAFFDVVYPIPINQTRDQKLVRVKLQSLDGGVAGRVFGCKSLVTR